ncbi:levansucrase [Phytohabitans sp. ZYX-F-186]|uniref:Levansucrase n=1 Tax=Phytohabitans maris TaxID=3071409 RepID=A0ABU0ZD59_9ACTN|nr:levansucrase [Phytohabitans sp. ZYX-F-186]MDQ7904990.1 levansucrase [Phytohabitans sp. ZYX-F-186]
MADQAVDAYIQATAARLAADGCEVSTEDWHGTPVLVGYRADFRLRWMATKLHLLTVVAPAATVTQAGLEAFTNTAFDYAQARKGQLRGLQSGVAVFPALVGTHADPAALAWAAQRQLVRFGSVARPVAVDVTTGAVGCFRRTAALGFVYSGHLRRKLELYFPQAAADATTPHP